MVNHCDKRKVLMKSRRLQSARFVSVWFCALAVAGGAILSFGVGAQYASGRRRDLQVSVWLP